MRSAGRLEAFDGGAANTSNTANFAVSQRPKALSQTTRHCRTGSAQAIEMMARRLASERKRAENTS